MASGHLLPSGLPADTARHHATVMKLATLCSRLEARSLNHLCPQVGRRAVWRCQAVQAPSAHGVEAPQIVPFPSAARSLTSTRTKASELQDPHIAYELVQGPLVRCSEVGPGGRPPPTAVMVHGILGSRRNMATFAHRLVEGFPAWQVLLVDLRCHGESASLHNATRGPHTVESAADDILKLLRQLKLFPEVLVGHSFGGKVVMSMADQFGRMSARLPRPVQVWVLDSLPGAVRAGDFQRKDHPADLIAHLRQLPQPIRSRAAVQNYLLAQNFSQHIARWSTTSLRPIDGDQQRLAWTFDLAGITEMYASYETSTLWPFLAAPAQGTSVHFVRAEASNYRWAGGDEARIAALGHRVHLLRRAGHWVHADNPEGLVEIMASAFQGASANMLSS